MANRLVPGEQLDKNFQANLHYPSKTVQRKCNFSMRNSHPLPTGMQVIEKSVVDLCLIWNRTKKYNYHSHRIQRIYFPKIIIESQQFNLNKNYLYTNNIGITIKYNVVLNVTWDTEERNDKLIRKHFICV